MMNCQRKISLTVCGILAGVWLIGLPLVGTAQEAVPESRSVGQYDPGTARPSTYYEPGGLRELGGRARRPRPEQEQITVLIKQGKKVYCAWSNQLLHNDVSFKEVPPEQAEKFFDDGTHNDEIPFDGLPSSVDRDNYTHIGPYGVLIALELELLKNKVITLDSIDRYKVHEWIKKNKYDPLRFYSGLHVTSLDGKTTLPKFSDKLADLTDYAEILDVDVIEQFRGYKPYQDKENPGHEAASLRNAPRIREELEVFEELPEYAQEYWRWVEQNRPKEILRDRGIGGLFGEGAYFPLDRARGAAGPPRF